MASPIQEISVNSKMLGLILFVAGFAISVMLFLVYRLIKQYDEDIKGLKNDSKKFGEKLPAIESDVEWLKDTINGIKR